MQPCVADVLDGAVERGDLTGAVSWVRHRGEERFVARGVLGPGRGALDEDSLFRISSLTKPVVAALTLALVDDGVLGLDDPVVALLPELADLRVARHPATGPLTDVVGLDREITTADLLTFRAGFGAQPEGGALSDAMEAGGVNVHAPDPAGHLPASAWLQRLATLPLAAQPGGRWLYHTSAEVLGVLLARAAARPLSVLLSERLLEPLGMTDTAFVVRPDQLDRLADAPDDAAATTAWVADPPFENAADGLVSTAADLRRFSDLFAAGGVHDGERLLSRAAHAFLTSDHLTAAQAEEAAFLDGVGWGAGMEVGLADGPRPGRYGWAGGLGTLWWNDPLRDLQMLLLTQHPVWTTEFATTAHAWERAVDAEVDAATT